MSEPMKPLSRLMRIDPVQVPGNPSLSRALKALLRAAVNQRRPSRALRRSVNELLDLTNDPLSTKLDRVITVDAPISWEG